MKKSILHRAAPWVLALVLLANYAAVVFGVPVILQPFARSNIEMPTPTIFAINFVRLLTTFGPNIVFTALILALSFTLAARQRWAWWVGFVFTIIFWFTFVPLLLPFVATYNSVFPNALTPQLVAPIALAILAAPLPSLIFFALHDAFRRLPAPQSQTLAA